MDINVSVFETNIRGEHFCVYLAQNSLAISLLFSTLHYTTPHHTTPHYYTVLCYTLHTLPYPTLHDCTILYTTCSALLYSTLLYSALLYTTYSTLLHYFTNLHYILYSALLYFTLHSSSQLYSTLLYSAILYTTYSTLFYTTLHYCAILYTTYSTLLYSTLLKCTLHTLLYSTLLYTVKKQYQYFFTFNSNTFCDILLFFLSHWRSAVSSLACTKGRSDCGGRMAVPRTTVKTCCGCCWETATRLVYNNVNNYSSKWRWMVVHIYWAAKRQGKYPPLSWTLRWMF